MLRTAKTQIYCFPNIQDLHAIDYHKQFWSKLLVEENKIEDVKKFTSDRFTEISAPLHEKIVLKYKDSITQLYIPYENLVHFKTKWGVYEPLI